MKKVFIAICVSLTVIGIGAMCYISSNNNEKVASSKIVEPEGVINASLKALTFEESLNEADLIAKVKILNQVEQIDKPDAATIFKSNVVEVFNNSPISVGSEINIMQQGNSKWVFNGNAPFKDGEEIILFLKAAVGFDNTYFIVSEEVNTYKFIEINKEEYVVKQAKNDKYLEAYEDKEQSKEINNYLESKKGKYEKVKDIQVFKADSFIKMLREKGKNNEIKKEEN